MRPRGWVAGRPILDATTEKRLVMRASVWPEKVARRSREGGLDEAKVGVEGKCRRVDSGAPISRIRMLVLAWSSV